MGCRCGVEVKVRSTFVIAQQPRQVMNDACLVPLSCRAGQPAHVNVNAALSKPRGGKLTHMLAGLTAQVMSVMIMTVCVIAI